MEKTIATVIMIIASVVATVAVINAVIPAVGKSSAAILGANSATADRIKTDVEILFVSGDSSTDQIVFWVKNVGTKTIRPISDSDVFLTTPTSVLRVPYTGSAPVDPRWDYIIEGGETVWTQAVTVKVTVHLQSGGVSTGLHKVSMAVYNAVSDEKEFGV